MNAVLARYGLTREDVEKSFNHEYKWLNRKFSEGEFQTIYIRRDNLDDSQNTDVIQYIHSIGAKGRYSLTYMTVMPEIGPKTVDEFFNMDMIYVTRVRATDPNLLFMLKMRFPTVRITEHKFRNAPNELVRFEPNDGWHHACRSVARRKRLERSTSRKDYAERVKDAKEARKALVSV